jgi:hypothetical protein
VKNILAWLRHEKPRSVGALSITVTLLGKPETVNALNVLSSAFLDASNSMAIAAEALAKFPKLDEDDE